MMSDGVAGYRRQKANKKCLQWSTPHKILIKGHLIMKNKSLVYTAAIYSSLNERQRSPSKNGRSQEVTFYSSSRSSHKVTWYLVPHKTT